jgi:hypothetical protein
MSATSLAGGEDEDKTVLKFYGGVDLLTTGNASTAIIASATSTSVSMKGGLGGGIQILVPLDANVRVGGEFGFIFTSFEQKSDAFYNGRETTASNYIGFSPLVALLDYRFKHVYLQGGIGVSIYRSLVTYDNTPPTLSTVSNSDVRTGGCAVIGAGVSVPLLGFLGLDFSVKYYSTFVSINGTTNTDALLMPTVAVMLQF